MKEKDFISMETHPPPSTAGGSFDFGWTIPLTSNGWTMPSTSKMECCSISLSNLIASYSTDEGWSGRDQRELRGRPLLRGQRQHSGHAHQQLDRQPCWAAVLDSASATQQNDESVFGCFFFPPWTRFDLLILKQKFLIWGIFKEKQICIRDVWSIMGQTNRPPWWPLKDITLVHTRNGPPVKVLHHLVCLHVWKQNRFPHMWSSPDSNLIYI